MKETFCLVAVNGDVETSKLFNEYEKAKDYADLNGGKVYAKVLEDNVYLDIDKFLKNVTIPNDKVRHINIEDDGGYRIAFIIVVYKNGDEEKFLYSEFEGIAYRLPNSVNSVADALSSNYEVDKFEYDDLGHIVKTKVTINDNGCGMIEDDNGCGMVEETQNKEQKKLNRVGWLNKHFNSHISVIRSGRHWLTFKVDNTDEVMVAFYIRGKHITPSEIALHKVIEKIS